MCMHMCMHMHMCMCMHMYYLLYSRSAGCCARRDDVVGDGGIQRVRTGGGG